jgi:hypothetical protein
MRDLLDDHPGLAAAGARQHQQGTFDVQHGLALWRVEAVHATDASICGAGRGLSV